MSLNENEYRGTHGNLRLGRVCKTNGGNARRTKNPPALAVGSVKGGVNLFTYKDRTWCSANCAADGSCGRMLMPEDRKEISEQGWLVSFSDFSGSCELYIPGEEAGNAT